MSRVLIKDYYWETRLFNARVLTALVLIGALFLLLTGRLVYLQVLSHDLYTTLSQNNSVRIEPLAPTRGLIYDRRGNVLAENIPSFSLEIIPEQIENLDLTLGELRTLVAISDEEVERFRKQLRRKRRFESIPLRARLNDDEVAAFAINRHRFPGVEVRARLIRHYPHGELTAHVIGYVGRINEEELIGLDATNYSATQHIGKIGVERSYEDRLHGRVGYRRVETNAESRVLRVLDRQPAEPGRDLMLNIDLRLQQAAYQAFGELNGAVVALDPNDGSVLAFISKPGYDPNPFVTGIAARDFERLQANEGKPLFNRALNGQYPPGSTIKPILALGALEENVIDADKRSFCIGYYQLEGDERRYRDWKREGHGEVDLDQSIVQSCDVYFYELAFAMGIDRIHAYLSRFGFGTRTAIDLPGEASGLLPSRDWKRRQRNEAWFHGETLITGIGQGFTLTTPLQLASATATLAAAGQRHAPRVLLSERRGAAEERPIAPDTLHPEVPMRDPENWQRMLRAMTEVVHGLRGTARGIARGGDYRIAGKTGTAQVFAIAQDEEYEAEEVEFKLRDHALFVAFAPAEQPRIAVAVIAEHGGSGGAVAAPIARKVMDTYLLDKAP